MSPRKADLRSRKCPICGRPAQAKFSPFCSKACADIDLGHWLGGRYVIPVREEDEADSALPARDGKDDT
ncbi:MAG: DNA gyrase inhibitor YacG [Rhizomicrobium sp.]